ncbi:MerR family transcriptional regulator [Erysipelothrix piscisicarius]|uniref:MerR family transcriptional regulator n=1 Tax=Erysipelothrix piscisicarius TaxID=2485784 RepID=A0A3S5HJW8_9FIRM|nr:helix-turn-helix domain-containing protein [Erysipelothrix piscisicarius]AZK43469.1 MerR family transcriptional regulator [Erysipelothrix piscisicarius]
MQKLRIGEIARLNDVSIQTLRYYDEIGLLKPASIDPETHYRYYTIEQSATLDMIQFLKRLDFNLMEIHDILKQKISLESLKASLKLKEEQLLDEHRSIIHQIQSIHHFMETTNLYTQNMDKHWMEISSFHARHIYRYPITQNIYEMSIDAYEYALRDFKHHLKSKTLFNRVGSIMSKENFNRQHFDSKELFVFVDDPAQANDSLPQGDYAVFFCQSFEDEIEAMHAFHQLINAQNLVINGDYICEVLYEMPNTNSGRRDMFIRLQVPILLDI